MYVATKVDKTQSSIPKNVDNSVFVVVILQQFQEKTAEWDGDGIPKEGKTSQKKTPFLLDISQINPRPCKQVGQLFHFQKGFK